MEEGPLVASGVISSPLSISCLANWICLYLLPSPSSKRRKGCGAICEKHRTYIVLIVLVGEELEMHIFPAFSFHIPDSTILLGFNYSHVPNRRHGSNKFNTAQKGHQFLG